MPSQIAEALRVDVSRVVCAGAAVARGDVRLAAHREVLLALAATLPATGKVTDALGALQAPAPADPSVPLLQLLEASSQLHASTLEPAAPHGVLKALADGPSPSPCKPAPPHVLYPVLGMLRSQKRPEDATRELLREHGAELVHDPRVWKLLMRGLHHQHLHEDVAAVVEKAGPAMLRVLEFGLWIEDGKSGHATRLRAIAAILGADGEALYRECLAHGSDIMKAAALPCFQHLGREPFEAACAEAWVDNPSLTTRNALVPALFAAGTRTTLQFLCDHDADSGVLLSGLRHLPLERFPLLFEVAAARLENLHLVDPRNPPFFAYWRFSDALVRLRPPGAAAYLRRLLRFPWVGREAAAALRLLGEHDGSAT